MGGFFISRPVFAWVLAIVTMLAGVWALRVLPVQQYPDIAPPTVRISASYPGATAEAVQASVTRVIEDGMTGIDGLLYMESASSQGSSRITLTFAAHIDPLDAQSEVQTQVGQIERRLPDAVRQQGVNVTRSTSAFLMVATLMDSTGSYDSLQLADIVSSTVEGPVQRTPGVGGISVFGSGYAMRVWLDPLSLVRFQLTPADVVSAVQAQNTTVSVGSLGDQPAVQGQQFTATVTAQSQLRTVEQFQNILLKTEPDGGAVYLGDVARVEVGQESYRGGSRMNGLPAAGFGINLADGANAVDTSAAVQETLARLTPALPEGLGFQVAYDTSPFVERSIERVYHTLAEAAVLVVLILLIFLQTWRATLIPMVAVPVVLLGTLAVLYAAGFSINTLTLFALVLAIGLLVDDAIVVVENVERLMHDEGMRPFEATRQSMGEITGALIGIVVVLSAVFLPMAFFPGAAGVIYRQFSLTIIAAMVLSLAVAVILTPALCASLLRQRDSAPDFALARWFNRNLDRLRDGYGRAVEWLLPRPFLLVVMLLAIIAASWQVWGRLNASFLPQEDQGVLMVRINLTEGSTSQQTLSVVQQVEDYLRDHESRDVDSVMAALGFGFGGSSQGRAMLFVKLKPFEERLTPERAAGAIAQRGNDAFRDNRAGRVSFQQPPTVRGLGNQAGFSMYLVDYADSGVDALRAASDQLVQIAGDNPLTSGVDNGNNADEPALKINIDQQKAESLGISLAGVNAMLSTVFSGTEVNDFTLGSSLRPVIVQADAPFRMQPDDIGKWYARNSGGEMVPFTAFMTTSWEPVAPSLARFDGTPALSMSGEPGQGASSGQAMDAIQAMVAEMPGGYGVAWTGISYQERQSGDQAPMLYALSMLIVFLALAALYESWSVPFAVMLSVPVGVLGALLAAWALGQSDDVYFKVGILTTIGLSARNAILIVEFAETLYAGGMDLHRAAVQAARQRLRPILMTTLTFMFGVLPLAIATGAGAKAQNAIGIAVLGGMITSTLIAIFMVPGFYVLVKRLFSRQSAGTP
ncbi:MAG: efflux RND transporter permease subunit [Paracoccus sp. (in: a-proteobacteria)]|uniref:efflux RND transporter permease subunit n=1 Tax=Paracoccus sp. TaxID=267 RepID=UPI0026E02859|nr:efflux RND transporter permease subunit [Paracoccus sp. (in: a-proteobacteria)]MDO5620326.1 efflux RND transporter permease subunit [Paracoccus sp. (in: a-proteobacteria)]